MLMACFYARKTLTEAAFKGITHQLTRSRGDISSIKYVKLVDKDTKTEQGLQTVILLSLPKLRREMFTSVSVSLSSPLSKVYTFELNCKNLPQGETLSKWTQGHSLILSYVMFEFCDTLAWGERSDCPTLIVFLSRGCSCYVTLPHVIVDWSVVRECGISWSYIQLCFV